MDEYFNITDKYDIMNDIMRNSGIFDDDDNIIEDTDTDTLSKRINDEVNIANKRYDKLKKQQAFINANLNFIFDLDNDLDDYQKWCFENDLIFMIKEVRLLGHEYQALIFKNVEDAMAFKLKWL